MPQAAKKKKATYAKLVGQRDKAQAALHKISRQPSATAEQHETALARYNDLQRQIDALKAAEFEKYPEHFRKSVDDKVKLLLLGWVEGGPKMLTHLHFPASESFLEEECLWALVRVWRRQKPPSVWVRRATASLYVPYPGHGLVEHPLVAKLGRRKPGATPSVFGPAQIVAALISFEKAGENTDDAVQKVIEWFGVLSRDYVYECLRKAPPEALRERPKKRRPKKRRPKSQQS